MSPSVCDTLITQRAACDDVWKVPEKVVSGRIVCTPGELESTSPLSILPGVEELAGTSAVNRPARTKGPGVVPLKFPSAPLNPMTKSAPSGPAPDIVCEPQVAVFCCTISPEPRTPVESISTMRPWSPVESMEKSYVGVPGKLEKISWPRLFWSVKVPVKV